MKYRELLGNKWFLLALNTAFFAIMAWILPITFEVDDDIAMCLVANGAYSGTPDGHLVCFNAMLGWSLAGLYRLFNAVEWYTLFLCVVHVVAVASVVFFVVNDKRMPPLLKWLFVLFLYIIWVRIIVAFQYTSTAGLLCFSGCMALQKKTKRRRLFGVCAVFVASLIRFKMAALIGLLCLPMLLICVFQNRKYAYTLVVVALLSLAGRWADNLFYRPAEWADYRAYNLLREKINDNPNAFISASELPEGVEMEDYQKLLGFNVDPKIITMDQLRELYSAINNSITLKKALSNLSQLKAYRGPIALVLLLFIISLLFCYGDLEGRLCRSNNLNLLKGQKVFSNHFRMKWLFVMVMTSLFFFAFLSYFSAFATPKHRVFVCMLLPIVYVFMAQPIDTEKKYETIMISIVILLLCCNYLKKDIIVVH